MKQYGHAAVLAALTLSCGCSGVRERHFVSHTINQVAPDFELKALDGGTVRLGDYRGKAVLLAFFAFG